ncbi:SH3 domain-containing protein [Paracoccus tegillarcae]|uniref:SH3b domain-containing protein n=1 Tax=Paracoccus tegillarcae TaxID=1529068 RepID=A0A2K9ETA5_9RHOB|nr:SH3 domain-containing protein [Paracoccus tegillarcae]AUH32454.1 hypothetical protein CUV01_02785 [Paracoccus tegillarcae]
MIRLTILTVLGLFAALTLFGDPDPDAPFNAATETAAAGDTDEATAADASPETVAAATTVASEVSAPAVPSEAVQQTPEQVQSFPGPALRPSPEYAGQAEVAKIEAMEQSGAQIMYVTGNSVNFRAGPSTNDRVIGALLLGSPVEALGQADGGWMQLRDAQGREGYMSAQFLSPDRPN